MFPSQDPAYEGDLEETIQRLEMQKYKLFLETEENNRQLQLAGMRKELEKLVGELQTWSASTCARHRGQRFKTNLQALSDEGFRYHLIAHVLFVERRPDLALVLALFLNSINCKLIEGNPASFVAFVIGRYPLGAISMERNSLVKSLKKIIREACQFEDIKALLNDWLEEVWYIGQSGVPVRTLCSTGQDRMLQVKIFRGETSFPNLSAVLQEVRSRNIRNASVVSQYLQREVQHSRTDGIVRATQQLGKDDLTIDLLTARVRVILPGRSATSQEAKVFRISIVRFSLQSMLEALTDQGIKVSTAFKRLMEEETRHPYPVLAIAAKPQLLPLPIIFLPRGKFSLEVAYKVFDRTLHLMNPREGHLAYYHGL
ncbi:hypothetical protein ATEIFO6365_0002001100 [Aspergillus terreus]|uniref:Uncharacterized protein n=1 Tax=Aspergillus terreus TaxID=33178 RepID=A0A5M3YT38_ASPTE|nr:hypothetical protein ATETN484_0004001100 [Aspergillus terreus]GFF12901.1 hypothetical protein ATEIFO6365_0002001100 [Aspergillus terreus]